MDKMSLFTILAVSLPEAVLNIYIGLLLTGHRSKLYLDDKINIVRLIITAPLMVSVTFFSRYILTELLLVVLFNVLLYTLILLLVYKIKWHEAVLAVLIFYGLLITIEIAYMPQFFVLFEISMEEYFASDLTRFFTSIPQRLIQLGIVVSLWNWDIVYLKLQYHKKLKYYVLAFTFLLFIAEVSFCTLFLYSLNMLTHNFRIYFSILSIVFVAVNITYFKMLLTFFKQL